MRFPHEGGRIARGDWERELGVGLLETIALVGGVLLAIVIAAMVGALVGRRFRTVAIERRTPDPHTAPDMPQGRAAMQPIARPEAMAAPTVGQTTADDGSAAGSSPVPGVAAGVAAASMAHAATTPPSAAAPSAGARPGPAFTLADPLARTAVPREAPPDYTTSAAFTTRPAGASAAEANATPGAAAIAAAGRAPGASPIADVQPDEWRNRANPAIKVRARRGEAGPKQEGRRARDWALNLTLIAAIAVVGAIAFSAFIWSPPDGDIALVTEPPDGSRLPVALGGDASPDPSGRTDEFGVVGLDTSTPPVTGDQTAGTDTGGTDGTPRTGSGGLRPSSRPPVGPTPAPGGGGATPDPTPPPTPDPTARPTPDPTPTPTEPPTPAPTATPRPPIVAFVVTVDGLAADFANRTKNAASWQWSFGDGSTSTARNPSHTYDSPGTYSVRLDATSTGGATDSLTKDVTVGG